MKLGIGQNVRRIAATVGIVFGVVLAGSVGFYGYLRLGGNTHVVETGAVYRSAQLGRDGFEQVIAAHGVRSILNLRGANPGKSWYDDELEVARSRGVTHYDYALSARRFVTAAQADEILAIIRTAPKPILIHCKTGADRTGLVSALYRYSRGVDARDADRELSLRFGHFPWLGSRSVAMDDSFRAYVGGAATIAPARAPVETVVGPEPQGLPP